jgi:hypothetical protein
LASIFSDSTILHDAIGGDISDLIIAVALRDVDVDYPNWGGKIWWKSITEMKGYRIQQNMFSRHYRLLDQGNRRIHTSFNLKEIEEVMEEIIKS